MDALESNAFLVPEELKGIPGTNVARDKAYDQIDPWKPNRIKGYVRPEVIAANVFDFFEHVYWESNEPIYRSEAPGNGMNPPPDSRHGERTRCLIIYRCGWSCETTSARSTWRSQRKA